MHIYYLGLFALIISVIAAAVVYVKNLYRFITSGIGCVLMAVFIWAPLDWLPSHCVKAIYPCDQSSEDYMKNMHIVMSGIQIPSDTMIFNFDLMTAQCGDTLYAYRLIKQTKYGLLYNGRTRTVISRRPMPEYEGKLTVPWLYEAF